VQPARLRLKVVASVLAGVLVCPAFAQQPPDSGEEGKRKTRVCAIEDETTVDSVDNPGTSRVLKPGYCVDCWMGFGCGSPFLASGLLGLIGGSAGAAGAATLGVVGGVLGGLAASGAFSGGDGNGPPPPSPTPGGTPSGVPTATPTSIPAPTALPTTPPVSPFQ
jgi:hypothetical protein